MRLLDEPTVKYGFATRAVPLEEMAGITSAAGVVPRVGDVVLAEVISVGKNKTIEDRQGRSLYLFPGDKVVGAFGNRYATDQYEGYVPRKTEGHCDMLSVGGVFGELTSRHAAMAAPTRLGVLGRVSDRAGHPVNQLGYALEAGSGAGETEVIAVVGSSMNSGKTTTAGTIARALSRTGYRVAAMKATGTAAGKDSRFYESCGAWPVLDFTSVGYPSTYMLGEEELLWIYDSLLGSLGATKPDYVVVEVADGIFQRETRMLLDSEEFRTSVDHLFFAASDSLSAESGVRFLQRYGLPLRATGGSVTQSALASREAEEAAGLPCLSTDRIMEGALGELLGDGARSLSPGVSGSVA